MKAKLNTQSMDWINQTTEILNQYAVRVDDYFALEGLPCAGKTTTILQLKQLAEYYVIDELRLPPTEESCASYLQQEPLRTENIYKLKQLNKMIVGDRCIVSTIAHKAALLSYNDEGTYHSEIQLLDQLAQKKMIVLPSKVLTLDISVETSRNRQKIRDRDILEGRLWFDSRFLGLINSSTIAILENLNYSAGVLRGINSEIHDPDQTTHYVKEFLEDKNGTNNYK